MLWVRGSLHMKYRDIVDAIHDKTGMEAPAIRMAIHRKTRSKLITSRQAALLLAHEKGIRIERYAKPEEIVQLQLVQTEVPSAVSGASPAQKKGAIQERPPISPYDIPLGAFHIDEELSRDCRLTKPYRAAIREATLTLETRIRQRLGLPDDKTGKDLILMARQKGIFKRLVPSEEEGLFFLYAGTISWLRNPPSHKKIAYERDEAVKIILFVDYLLRLFDSLCSEKGIP